MKKKWQLNKRDAQNFLTVALYDVTCHSIDFLVVLICKVFLSIKNEFAVAGNITPPRLSRTMSVSLSLFLSGTVCLNCGPAEGEKADAVCFMHAAMRSGRWWIPPLRTLQNTSLQLRVSAVRALHTSTDVRNCLSHLLLLPTNLNNIYRI